jgi:hypothetical protein
MSCQKIVAASFCFCLLSVLILVAPVLRRPEVLHDFVGPRNGHPATFLARLSGAVSSLAE